MLKLYNTLTRRLEVFKPIKKKQVGLYSCGPTAYDYAHLGNLRAYVFVDLLKRYLKYQGYQVKHVMNVTDVDDKTIRASRQAGKTLKEFTDTYTAAFLEDMAALNIERADVLPRATEHIKEMVRLVKALRQNGYAYEADGSIYFKISRLAGYGKLAQLEKQSLKKNAARRLTDDCKKEDVSDFVLWKAWRPEDGPVFWETELGKGRPGWHIECSAMSMKYLDSSFDIHTGGVDLIFPHHTNEIAQSEGATTKKFVNYWLHNAHLMVDGKKMSKSLGNFYTLRDIQKKGYHDMLTRLILLKTHYRKVLDFSLSEYKEARTIAEKFVELLANLEWWAARHAKSGFDCRELIRRNQAEFERALDDDLNISLGLAAAIGFVNEANKASAGIGAKEAALIRKHLQSIDAVLGFIFPLYGQYQKRLNKLVESKEIKRLLKERQEARQKGGYALADQLRGRLSAKGLIINDVGNDQSLRLADLL